MFILESVWQYFPHQMVWKYKLRIIIFITANSMFSVYVVYEYIQSVDNLKNISLK